MTKNTNYELLYSTLLCQKIAGAPGLCSNSDCCCEKLSPILVSNLLPYLASHGGIRYVTSKLGGGG